VIPLLFLQTAVTPEARLRRSGLRSGACACLRACLGDWQRVRRALLRSIAALAFAAAVHAGSGPQIWDAQRMLAAAAMHGPSAVASVRELQAMLALATDFEDTARLAAVNQFFNRRIVFMEDAQNWNRTDYWASPVELLARGAGDCEDYVIAKYFSLLLTGVPKARLRLVYVRLQVGGPQGAVLPHMVLAYYAAPNAEPVILDNLVNDVKPASRRLDLIPVFSFNSDSLWQGVDGPPVADSIARLSRWREVLAKARAEGFQ
jgi:predicted transglutaminase-like cysteine proteinase